MGADRFIATGEGKDWAKKNAGSIDLIVSTVSSHDMPLEGYLQLLKTYGQFIQVGVPEEKLPSVPVTTLIGKGSKIGGSAIGSPAEIEVCRQTMADLIESCPALIKSRKCWR